MAKEFWTIDCETDPFLYGRIPQPFLWGAYNGIDYFEFETAEQLYNFIKGKDALFYAHNGGKFDFHYLAKFLTPNKKLLMINVRLTQAKIGKAEIRDSYSLLPFPLHEIGGKKEIEYWKLEKKHRKKHMAEIKEYMKQDCVALYEAIAAFFLEYGRHLTSAGAAIKTLMKMEQIKIENSGSYFFNEFNAHYFGGRCECLKPGAYNEELTYLDINSAYPFAMLHEHPIDNEWNFEYEEKPEIQGHNFYTIRARSYGAFCRREKSSLKFDWDGETREYHTTGWELLSAIETGKADNIEHIRQKTFSNTKNFSRYINHFWDERQRWKKGTYQNLFAKLMMNSAYGKFAANPSNYDTFVLYEPEIAEFIIDNGWKIRGEIGDNLLCSTPLEAEFMRYYNVATGASITGFVRAMLMKAISNVHHPIYCDTDSLIFTGDHNLPLSNDLGAWKIEGIFNEGYFAGKKLYAVRNNKEEKIASKGWKGDFETIKDITLGKHHINVQDAPTFSWLKEPKFTERKIKKTA